MGGVVTHNSRQCLLSPERRAVPVAIFAAAIVVTAVSGQSSPLPNQPGSVKFAAIGDNVTSEQPQYDVARGIATFHTTFPSIS
jgi:hypothetical protein